MPIPDVHRKVRASFKNCKYYLPRKPETKQQFDDVRNDWVLTLITAEILLDKADEDVYSELQDSAFHSHLFAPGRIIA